MPAEQTPSWAGDGSEPDPSELPGSRTHRRRQRQRFTRLVLIAVVAAIVVGLLLAPGVRSLLFSHSSSANPGLASQTAGSDPGGLFTGTPAAAFASGADAIQQPPAQQQGVFAAPDVAAATLLTKQILVAARLDPAMLQRGDLTGYLAKLAPSLRPMVTSAVQKGNGALGYVTRLAPTAKLAPEQVRVSGAMTVSVGSEGQLVISADYVWVYPLVRAGKSSSVAGGSLVVLHTVETYEWYQPAKVATADRGLRTGGGELNAYNKDCAQFGLGYLALVPLSADGHAMAPATAAYNPKVDPSTLLSSC
jgi:hypothetical protein